MQRQDKRVSLELNVSSRSVCQRFMKTSIQCNTVRIVKLNYEAKEFQILYIFTDFADYRNSGSLNNVSVDKSMNTIIIII